MLHSASSSTSVQSLDCHERLGTPWSCDGTGQSSDLHRGDASAWHTSTPLPQSPVLQSQAMLAPAAEELDLIIDAAMTPEQSAPNFQRPNAAAAPLVPNILPGTSHIFGGTEQQGAQPLAMAPARELVVARAVANTTSCTLGAGSETATTQMVAHTKSRLWMACCASE